MPPMEVAYLGPAGTYSHLVAEKRFGARCTMLPFPTILEVCRFVSKSPSRRGVVPIENSSGGAIYETVDILLENKPPVRIVEELSLDVKLALMGHRGESIRTLYSHFAPIEHCATWLRRHLPRVQRRVVTSTAAAAQRAAEEPDAAALGNRRLAKMYDLDVLQYPVEADVPNVTVFVAVGGRVKLQPGASKTSLAVKLPNEPGSLCTFLEAFRDAGVNLCRIVSRPIRGCPREYAFLVDIDGSPAQAHTRQALRQAARACVRLRIISSFPCRRPYKS